MKNQYFRRSAVLSVSLLALIFACGCSKSGTAKALAKAIPQGAVPVQSEKDPSEVYPNKAYSWKDVKYAFCSPQSGYSLLIDFEGADLSTQSSGTFKFGVRSCDGKQPYKWLESSAFTLSTTDTRTIINFGNSLSPKNCYGCGNDLVEFSGSFDRYAYAYGVLGGNSGSCVFLQNKGTAGFDSDPSFRCK